MKMYFNYWITYCSFN